LRQDNADMRLTEKGRELGLIDDARWRAFSEKRESIEAETSRLESTWIQANSDEAKALEPVLKSPLTREYSMMDLLRRPELSYGDVACLKGDVQLAPSVTEQVEIAAKYSGYIERQQEEINRLRAQQGTHIPDDFDYFSVQGLSNELQEKLSDAKPETIARASRIPGVTPAAVSLLLVYLKKHGAKRGSSVAV